MWPDHRIQDLLGIELPIIQAPMAGSAGLDMVVAVSEAGGLGSLACASLDTERLRQLLAAAHQNTSKPFNINFFAHTVGASHEARNKAWLERLLPYYGELEIEPPKSLSSGSILPFDAKRCAIVEEMAPAIVSFHFGLPDLTLVRRLKAAGIKILSSATTVAEARWLENHGCDAIIAQGVEAGGHRGMFMSDDIDSQMGTFALVPQIVDELSVPVIAAGGVADGRGIAAAFTLGASGVQIGTAYLFTREATLSDAYRRTLQSFQSKESHRPATTLTNVLSGRPSRCIVNRLICEMGPLSDAAPAFPSGFSALMPLRQQTERMDNRDFSAHYCGQAAGLGHPTNARQLTIDLGSEALRRLNS
jgi:nitronate monooxygenase